ncbi:uncharacterized protein DSM5745_04357 [Aspergillus mulundensis]|uniref:Uncharacterized protein n=1 Tax=Aspergillus mulundensis TaxID=1810919 RepID=A0A3D8SCZ6_9EURO|nr:hypothetical protein DSM5745_04357 [Aspergillus mulundensis]RDW84031.1 hypothetical protein DSM5745_04357 [Aspergillus mulundensis]
MARTDKIGMDDLPQELIDQIVREAFITTTNKNDTRTMLRLRKLNRSFYHSATPLLFQSISIHINRVCGLFETDWRPFGTLQNNAHFVQDVTITGFTRSDTGKLDIEMADIFHIRSALEGIPHFLKRLPNLSGLHFDLQPDCNGIITSEVRAALAEAVQSTLAVYFPVNMQRLHLNPLDVLVPVSEAEAEAQMLASQPVLRYALEAGGEIESRYRNLVSQSYLRRAIPSLQELTLASGLWRKGSKPERGIYHALADADSLQRLKVSRLVNDEGPSLSLLPRCAPLRHLVLERSSFPENELVAVLENFACRLETLVVDNVRVADGCWESVLETTFGKCCRLREFQIAESLLCAVEDQFFGCGGRHLRGCGGAACYHELELMRAFRDARVLARKG